MFASRILLFLSLLLAPAALPADVVIPVSGSGSFGCAFYPANTGYSAEVDVSVSGKDEQGNLVSADLSAFTKNGPQCSPLPSQFGAGLGSGLAGSVIYRGVTYIVGDSSASCETYIASSPQSLGGCVPYFNVGQNGYLTLTLSGPGPGSLSFVDLQLEGWTDVTSVIFGQEPIQYDGRSLGDFYYSQGTFVVGAPEPVTWALIICAAPLLLVRIKVLLGCKCGYSQAERRAI